MNNIWKKYNILINIAGFLAVLFLVLFFVVFSLQRSIQKNSDEIQRNIIDGDMNKSRISKIPEMEKVEEAFAENKNNLNIILNSDNEVDFIKKIESLAEETGNKIDLKIDDTASKNQKPAAASKDQTDIKNNLPYSKYLSIQINLEGNYDGALNFIHKLENMNYYVNIISLNMIRSVQDQTNKNGGNASPFGASSLGVKGNTINASVQVKNENVLKSSLGVVVYLEN
ncbi:MAG: hypothetical protein WCX17_01845 [Parcubacteria group bacterium]|jgi:hypothetical protein